MRQGWRWPSAHDERVLKGAEHIGFTDIGCYEPVPRSKGTAKQAKRPRGEP